MCKSSAYEATAIGRGIARASKGMIAAEEAHLTKNANLGIFRAGVYFGCKIARLECRSVGGGIRSAFGGIYVISFRFYPLFTHCELRKKINNDGSQIQKELSCGVNWGGVGGGVGGKYLCRLGRRGIYLFRRYGDVASRRYKEMQKGGIALLSSRRWRSPPPVTPELMHTME